MPRNETETVVSLILKSLGYNNGIQLVTFGLLIERTSSIYLKVRLRTLASVNLFFYYKLYIIGVNEKINKERSSLSH
jgi:hypothetical protein